MNTKDIIANNISVTDSSLYFAGQNVVDLAKRFGTPLYLLDEDKVRENARTYIDGIKKAFFGRARIMYASKALSFKYLYKVIEEEGLGIDVVSSGEIMTAISAGFNLKNACFHSNNKTDSDIDFAIKNKIGCFVVDNVEELISIDNIARENGISQDIMLRITPGIDPHTFDAVSTGKVDSKFGSAIETGQALEITKKALLLQNINLLGFHCHVGSQVFEPTVYLDAVEIMTKFIKSILDETGFVTKELDLGGGFGVRYLPSQPVSDIKGNLLKIADKLKECVEKYNIEMPIISFEPGRSIVADAGMTIYTVGTVKRITGFKNYVSVDGGMTDNPRYALYKAPYTLLPANKMADERDMCADVVGRCCESGDIVESNVSLPSSIKRGDLIACLTTGAYNYSMASNYNRIPRPPIVVLKNGNAEIKVRRETPSDIVALDL